MKKHLIHLKYLLRHKWFVMVFCFRRGLYWRGIKHDWSKFLPSEWLPYVEYFNGDWQKESSTPPEDVQENLNIAWNHHQKRNDHHWQYWLLHEDEGNVIPLQMPHNCMIEMICDWQGAGKALGKPNTWEWYAENKNKMHLHHITRTWVEVEMLKLATKHGQMLDDNFVTMGSAGSSPYKEYRNQ